MQGALNAIRGDFNEPTWRAFEMTTFEQLNSSEAARELNVTPNAVRKSKARVLQRLREELGDIP
jgi:DNA-directed RNA polymerase specialized sigma24 family protein